MFFTSSDSGNAAAKTPFPALSKDLDDHAKLDHGKATKMLRYRELLLVCGVVLWTIALVPAWSQTDVAGVESNRFCLGWWNSPLVESLERREEAGSYSGTTNIRFVSWSAVAFCIGAILFFVHSKLQPHNPTN